MARVRNDGRGDVGRLVERVSSGAWLPKDKLRQLLLYDPHNTMVPVDSPKSRVTGIIQLGNKGLNLVNEFRFWQGEGDLLRERG